MVAYVLHGGEIVEEDPFAYVGKVFMGCGTETNAHNDELTFAEGNRSIVSDWVTINRENNIILLKDSLGLRHTLNVID